MSICCHYTRDLIEDNKWKTCNWIINCNKDGILTKYKIYSKRITVKDKALIRIIWTSNLEDNDYEKYEDRLIYFFDEEENMIVYWEPRYKGFRGTCKECENNWPMS